LIAVAALAIQVSSGRAQTVTLAPGDNSSVQVNTSGPNAGVVNWSVNGDIILNPAANGLQWFYYSVGNGTPAGVQNIGTPVSTAVTSPTPDSASFGSTYANGALNLQAVYTLTGGPVGDGASDLQETITVKNLQASTMNFRFFQYAAFTIPDPSVSLYPLNARGNSLYYLAQIKGTGVSLAEYVDGTLNPGANAGTITPNLLTLTSTPGFQLTGVPVATNGPGGSWLLEWNANLAPGSSFILSKDLQVTGIVTAPELTATSFFAGLLALSTLIFFRRRTAH
jgi:hypothetical protein